MLTSPSQHVVKLGTTCELLIALFSYSIFIFANVTVILCYCENDDVDGRLGETSFFFRFELPRFA